MTIVSWEKWAETALRSEDEALLKGVIDRFKVLAACDISSSLDRDFCLEFPNILVKKAQRSSRFRLKSPVIIIAYCVYGVN